MSLLSAEFNQRLLTPPAGWQERAYINHAWREVFFAVSIPQRLDNRGAVVAVQGMGETSRKYIELAHDMNDMGISFATFDRVGQGYSERYLLKHPEMVHSTGFASDVQDIIDFCRKIFPDQKVTLMGHSTGGLLAMMAYHKAPELFNPPVLSAPLMGIQDKHIRGREEKIAQSGLAAFAINSLQERYIYGGKGWRQRGTDGLKNPERFSSHNVRNLLRDHWGLIAPQTRSGDVSYGWLYHACRAIAQVNQPEFLKTLGPLTIFIADKDILVDNNRIAKAVQYLPRDSVIPLHDCCHEIPFERDEHRVQLINALCQSALGENVVAKPLPPANAADYDVSHGQRFSSSPA